MFMVIVDAHSKWLDVVVVTTPSSQQAIKVLRNLFATHGLLKMLVSDNGPALQNSRCLLRDMGSGMSSVPPTTLHRMGKQKGWKGGPDIQGGNIEDHWRPGREAGQVPVSIPADTSLNNRPVPGRYAFGSQAMVSP